MRLTHSECAGWCRAHGFPVHESDSDGRPAPRVLEAGTRIAVVYPEDSRHKVQLSREVVTRLAHDQEVLLWLDDWAVWPSSQHMPLFTRFREALGEKRPRIEAPGHLFQPRERDDAISVLAMAMLFFWDCHVLPGGIGPAFFTSHDEWNALVRCRESDDETTRDFGHWLAPEKT